MSRTLDKMTAQMELFIRMEARGYNRAEILKAVFDLDVETSPEKEIHNADSKMSRWRKREDVQAVWDEEVRLVLRKCLPRAVNKISEQIDSKEGWLANKAANDAINLAKSTSIFQTEDNSVTVRIEGMPELGSPEE